MGREREREQNEGSDSEKRSEREGRRVIQVTTAHHEQYRPKIKWCGMYWK